MMRRKLLLAMTATAFAMPVRASGFQKLDGVRIFVGPSAGVLSLGGDFDGTHELVGQTGNTIEFADVDQIKTAVGPGFSVGTRFSPFRNVDLGLDIDGYWSHHSTPLDVKDDLRTFDFNLRTFFCTHHRVQPSLLIGLAVYDFTEPNADAVYEPVDQYDYAFFQKDAHFTGSGLNVGVGLSWFILTRLSIDATFIWREGSIRRLNDVKIDPPLSVSAPTGQIALLYHFGGRVRSLKAAAQTPANAQANAEDFTGKTLLFEDRSRVGPAGS